MSGDLFEAGSVRPLYESYCISNVAPTLLSVLGVEHGRTTLPRDVLEGVDTTGVQNVVLFVFDGLGYGEWQRHTSGPGFLGRMARRGKVTPITSVFPSTTSAALTSITTGMTPKEHGLIEWYLYLKEIDMIVQSLPFSPMGMRGSDLLRPYLDPRVLVSGESIFPRLGREGVGARSYLARWIAHSAYSELIHGASDVLTYTNASDLSVALRRKLESERGPSFHYVYWSSIDTQQHIYGPRSEQAYIEAAGISGALGLGLGSLDASTASKTLFVVTADHGHVLSSTDDSLWLNKYKKLKKSFARGPSRKPILPWGAPRDVYLKVEEDRTEEVYQYLSDEITDQATVTRSSDAAESGLFGTGPASSSFLDRIGNLMILAKKEGSVWYHHPGVDEPSFRGQHGGMHRDEMTVPLAVARASSVSA